MFYCTDRAIRPGGGMGAIGLALTTCACLVSGHAETAAQVLLMDGLFFVWRYLQIHGWRGMASGPGRRAALGVVAGWVLGACLSAPQSLPTLEYARTSYRVAARANAPVETPPAGFKAMLQLLLPDFNGATRGRGLYFGGPNEVESASVGYAGLITALLLAPLAILCRERRSLLIFFALLGLLGVGQIIQLPLLRQVNAMWPLNLMRQNRLVLATGWSIAVWGVVGLDVLCRADFHWRGWLSIFAAATAALGMLCAWRAVDFPHPLRNLLARTPWRAAEAAHWFAAVSLQQAGICAIALVGWAAIRRGMYRRRWLVWAIGLVAAGEMVTADFGVYPQSDPALYYPSQPLLEALSQAPPGRVCGVGCFPASLTEMNGLLDVRGYDGFSPLAIVELLHLAQPSLPIASGMPEVVQRFYPAQFPSPITRMIDLRYMMHTGSPPAGRQPIWVSDGYWACEDPTCLPRVFVPRRFEIVDDKQQRLRLLSRGDFDPAELAYVESAATKPGQPAQGTARIVRETPSHLAIEYDLRRDGLVVLSDLWDAGWQARINGKPVAVLRVNHAFRGVIAPTGKGVIQYDYEPAGFELGFVMAAVAAFVLAGWAYAARGVRLKVGLV
jgi:hypothetical protein